MKLYLRLDGNDHDANLSALITAGRLYAEQFQNRSYMTQTLEFTMDKWKFPIGLPRSPIQSVTSITYTDNDGVQRTFTDYVTDIGDDYGWIALKHGSSVPTVQLKRVGGITIRYVAGYGTAAQVPEHVKLAIKLFVAHRFENPEVEGIPTAVQHLLWPTRVVPV